MDDEEGVAQNSTVNGFGGREAEFDCGVGDAEVEDLGGGEVRGEVDRGSHERCGEYRQGGDHAGRWDGQGEVLNGGSFGSGRSLDGTADGAGDEFGGTSLQEATTTPPRAKDC